MSALFRCGRADVQTETRTATFAFCFRKEKKEGKRESKTDRESDVEKAKANAVLWELRLKATEESLRDYTESFQKLARANEHITTQLYHAEKDSIHVTGHWQRQLAAKDGKVWRQLTLHL